MGFPSSVSVSSVSVPRPRAPAHHQPQQVGERNAPACGMGPGRRGPKQLLLGIEQLTPLPWPLPWMSLLSRRGLFSKCGRHCEPEVAGLYISICGQQTNRPREDLGKCTLSGPDGSEGWPFSGHAPNCPKQASTLFSLRCANVSLNLHCGQCGPPTTSQT